MSTQEIVQTMQRIARHEAGQVWAPALATVTSVHAGDGKPDYACTVRLRESGMVLPRVPIATGLIGTVALPADGDLVVIVFIGGHLHAPVVVGRLYHRDLPPPEHQAGEVVGWLPQAGTAEDETIRVAIRTPDDGPRAIVVSIAGEVEVKVTVDDERIELVAGSTSLTLVQSGSSDGQAELKVGDSSVVIEQGGDVSIVATGVLELKANEVKISGEASVKVTGQIIDLN
jgi:hypothetical protein